MNSAVPYYQTLKEIPWPLKQEKLKNDKFSKKKLEKNCKN